MEFIVNLEQELELNVCAIKMCLLGFCFFPFHSVICTRLKVSELV
jgi:hypothetical protein